MRTLPLVAVAAALVTISPVHAYAGDWTPKPDTRPCFARSEIDTVHRAWHRTRIERHTETVGAGIESPALRPDWTRVDYPGCVTGQTVVVFYDARGRWMSLARS